MPWKGKQSRIGIRRRTEWANSGVWAASCPAPPALPFLACPPHPLQLFASVFRLEVFSQWRIRATSALCAAPYNCRAPW